MENKEEVSYIENLEKKSDKAFNFKLGSLIFSATTLAILGLSGLMALAGQVAADADMTYLKNNVGRSEAYLGDVQTKRAKLVEAFTNGEIDYEEYKAACDFLYSGEHLISYMANSSDPKLNSMAESYNKSKDFVETLAKKGLPTYGGITGAGLASATVAEMIERKYRRKLAEQNRENSGFTK